MPLTLPQLERHLFKAADVLRGAAYAYLIGEFADSAGKKGGELMHFDRVLTNPPFSINWGNVEKDADGKPAWRLRFEAKRFTYSQAPLGAKKADLMFLLHMLAVTRDGGMVATVLPHGVLFRGGEERSIRAGIIEDDLLTGRVRVTPLLTAEHPTKSA